MQLFVGPDKVTSAPGGGYSSPPLAPEAQRWGGMEALYTLDFAGGENEYLKLDYNLVGSGNGRADLIALIPTTGLY